VRFFTIFFPMPGTRSRGRRWRAGAASATAHRPDVILMDIQLPFSTATRPPAASRPIPPQAHSDHRHHFLCAERRRDAGARRRLRRLCGEAFQPAALLAKIREYAPLSSDREQDRA